MSLPPRCDCGKFSRVGASHDCAASIAVQLERLARYRQLHPCRWREAISEGVRYSMHRNPADRSLRARRAWEGYMRPRRARRAAIDWQSVGQLRKQGLTWRRIAFMHREPETTFKRWARQELTCPETGS